MGKKHKGAKLHKRHPENGKQKNSNKGLDAHSKRKQTGGKF